MNNSTKIMVLIGCLTNGLIYALTSDQEAFNNALIRGSESEVLVFLNKPGFNPNFPEAQKLFAQFISGRNILGKKMADFLIDHGMNVNFRMENSDSPLLAAARQGDSAMAFKLLKHGAQINYQNDQGMTPLMATIAAEREQGKLDNRILDTMATAQMLMREGADVNLKDKSGKIAQDYALRKPQFAALFGQSAMQQAPVAGTTPKEIEAFLNKPSTINYLKGPQGTMYLRRIGIRR